MRPKFALTALLGALVLALAVQAASANSLSTNSERFYAIWNEASQPLTLAGALEDVCNVTLLGSFHSQTIAKTQGTLIGSVTHVELSNCSSPTIILEESLPWSLTFESFSGTLPNITSIRLLLIGAAFHIAFNAFAECLARTTTENPAAGEFITSTGELQADNSLTIPITDAGGLSFLCEGNSGRFEGSASTENGSGGSLAITLI